MPRRSDPFGYRPQAEDEEASSGIVVVKPIKPNIEMTPKTADDLIHLVEEGMMIQDAANYMMIHPKTIRSWLQAGDAAPNSEYGWFATRLRQAQAVFLKEMVGNVRVNAKRDGNVALKALEKAARGDWGASATADVNITGKVVHEHIGADLARIVEERKAKKLAENAESTDVSPIPGVFSEVSMTSRATEEE